MPAIPFGLYEALGQLWWTGLAPSEFEFPFPGSLISIYLPDVRKRPRVQVGVSGEPVPGL